ncbi:PTS sugar transporter subunit IIA [Arcanobacterium canis]
MFNIFKRHSGDSPLSHKVDVFSPVPGKLSPLDRVPDPTFAGGHMGKGFAVLPESNEFCAPIAGEITMIAGTHHAFTVRSEGGAEVLVHIGVNTVGLGGVGFSAVAELGQKVEAGDPVLRIDDTVEQRAVSMLTPVVVTSLVSYVASEPHLEAGAGEPVMVLMPSE